MVWLWTTRKSRIRAVEEEFPGSDQQGVLNTSGWHSSEPKDTAAEGSSGWHPRGGEGGWTGVRSSAIYLVAVQLFRGCSLQSFSPCGLLSCLELL